MHTISGMQSST